jgi:K+-transporting ATPase ATPase B chain
MSRSPLPVLPPKSSPYEELKLTRRATRRAGLFAPELLRTALKQSFIMLRPDVQWTNPVMFVVEVGTALTILFTIAVVMGYQSQVSVGYLLALDIWLLLTLLFANFATALAEARGKAQADALRKTRRESPAYRFREYAAGMLDVPLGSPQLEETVSTDLKAGDIVLIEAGQVIPSDGEIIEGVASVDESAITGESAPVVREAGGDRSGVTGGTRVLSDRIIVRITAGAGKSFLDRMIALVEGAVRQRTPNEIALSLVLSAFTLIFLLVTAALWPMAYHAELYMKDYLNTAEPVRSLGTDIPTLVALLVCLIPTTIGALLAAIGIAGMDRALRANILAKSGKAVEVAGDIDTLLLDKTGTITMGNRRATQFLPLGTFSAADLGRLAALASVADQTPEGKSIVDLYHKLPEGQGPVGRIDNYVLKGSRFIEFTAQTRMSGVDLPDGRQIRKGAPDAMIRYVQQNQGLLPPGTQQQVDTIASRGATPLLVCEGNKLAGLVMLEDILKPGMRDRFERLRRMGLRTVMVTGDNPLTAKAIAEQAGVDDYIAQATPEAKLAYIRQEQTGGKLVAMMGDGTNDAPALAQADVGVAMNSGTQAAKEAGNMVDLDSDPTKLIEVVEIGKQLLMTRGALTTFSIANDLAKYFAIVPALFAATLPWLKPLDIMHLHSTTSAILSAVIFNALIIPLLIPIALRGVKYTPVGADALLRRNLLLWGLGGVLVPFVGIKIIDLVLVFLGLV